MALTLQQLENRKHSIGGSDAAAAIGICQYTTPYELYLIKIGEVIPEDISDKDAVYWGNRLESIVAEEYARRTGNLIAIEPDTLYHKKYPFISAHIDRRIINEKRILECKTTKAFLAHEWGDIDTDEVPFRHIVQTQHYLNVTELEAADLAVLIGGQDYRIYHIPRDDDLIHDIETAEISFWNKVESRTPPDPINLDDLKLMYRVDSGQAIIANTEINSNVTQLRDVNKKLKLLDKEKDQLKFIIQSYMGNATTLLNAVSRKQLITWKTQDNFRLNQSLFKTEHPEIYQRYVKNSPSRVMRVK